MLAYEAWGGERRGRYCEFVLEMAERGRVVDLNGRAAPAFRAAIEVSVRRLRR